MSLDPLHFIELAERLARASSTGRPRQVDLRRAISTAYYGVFHATARALADEWVGSTQRALPRYRLAYRSVDHGVLNALCVDVLKQNTPARYVRYFPSNGFGIDLKQFSAAFIDLQERRHAADYDPFERFKIADAELIVSSAKTAIGKLSSAPAEELSLFLALIVCKVR